MEFRVIDREPDGTLHLHVGPAAAAYIAHPPEGVVRWIDLEGPDPTALATLQAAFALHPLAIADCAAYGRQSRFEDYDDYLFIVSHAFSAKPHAPLDIQIHEVHAFLGQQFLITVHDNPVTAHNQIWLEAQHYPRLLAKGIARVWLQTVSAMVDGSEAMIDNLREELDILEREVVEAGANIELTTAFRIKRTTVAMRRVLRPLRDALRQLVELSEDPDPRIPSNTARYIHALTDRVVRLTEFVEDARETANSIVAGYHAVQATHANTAMKRLTIFSAVFLPLGFVVGFWGQNFTQLPVNEDWAFAFMLVSMLALPLATLLWIRTWYRRL